MIHLKKEHEITIMQEGGAKLKRVLDKLLSEVKPGISGLDIDTRAETLIRNEGGEPSFQKVKGYKWTTCICTNDIVVHGIPNDEPIKAGDVLGLDIGMFYKGFHTDTSWSIVVGDSTKFPKTQRFLKKGEETLSMAIDYVKIGNRIGDISDIIEKNIKSSGFGVVRELVGHGVGRNLHEDPEIPGIVRTTIEKTPLIKKGMVLAVEVIYTLGSPDVFIDEDGWTIRTKDGKISGLFEKTVAVDDHGVLVLT